MTVKQVWSFLGFGNFYRKFIGHYADIAWPLNNLTKKDLTWNWTDTCEEAFEKLKEEFQKAPVLLMPNSTKPFVIESDASKFATGSHTTKGRERRLPPLWIYISLLQCDTTKLWNIWPRAHGYCPRSWNMATLAPRIPFPHGDPIWPQKPHVLQNRPEVNQTTGSMEPIPIRVWSETHPHPRI